MKKGYFWFDLYTTILIPLGLIISAITFLATCFEIYNNNAGTSTLQNILIIFDLFYLFFSIKVFIDIKNKDCDSIKELCLLHAFNWFFKTFFVIVNTYENAQNIVLNCLIVFMMLGIYYIPSIIYFYKRKDLFINYNEDDLIKESDEDADEFIRKLKEKNNKENTSINLKISEGTRTSSKDSKMSMTSPAPIINTIDNIKEKYICKVCGKQIEYNENRTCEECHKKILERIEQKNTKYIECKVCGKEIPYNDKNICSECEKKLLDKLKEPEKRFCTKCGKEIKHEWEFCNYCGNKLK